MKLIRFGILFSQSNDTLPLQIVLSDHMYVEAEVDREGDHQRGNMVYLLLLQQSMNIPIVEHDHGGMDGHLCQYGSRETALSTTTTNVRVSS